MKEFKKVTISSEDELKNLKHKEEVPLLIEINTLNNNSHKHIFTINSKFKDTLIQFHGPDKVLVVNTTTPVVVNSADTVNAFSSARVLIRNTIDAGLYSGSEAHILNASAVLSGHDVRIHAYNNTRIRLSKNAEAILYDDSRVSAYDESIVNLFDNSHARIYSSDAIIKNARDYSSFQIYEKVSSLHVENYDNTVNQLYFDEKFRNADTATVIESIKKKYPDACDDKGITFYYSVFYEKESELADALAIYNCRSSVEPAEPITIYFEPILGFESSVLSFPVLGYVKYSEIRSITRNYFKTFKYEMMCDGFESRYRVDMRGIPVHKNKWIESRP